MKKPDENSAKTVWKCLATNKKLTRHAYTLLSMVAVNDVSSVLFSRCSVGITLRHSHRSPARLNGSFWKCAKLRKTVFLLLLLLSKLSIRYSEVDFIQSMPIRGRTHIFLDIKDRAEAQVCWVRLSDRVGIVSFPNNNSTNGFSLLRTSLKQRLIMAVLMPSGLSSEPPELITP